MGSVFDTGSEGVHAISYRYDFILWLTMPIIVIKPAYWIWSGVDGGVS